MSEDQRDQQVLQARNEHVGLATVGLRNEPAAFVAYSGTDEHRL